MAAFQPKWFVEVLWRGYSDVGGYIHEVFSDTFVGAMTRANAYSDEYLMSAMYSLGRFNCHVQSIANQFGGELIDRKRYFERLRREALDGTDIPTRTTKDRRLEIAYENNPELSKVEDEVGELEKNLRLYEKMPERINELIQIIKRELDRRTRFRLTT